MRGSGLRILLIFLDVVALGAVAGAVFLCFFSTKLNAQIPQPVNQSISVPQTQIRSVGFSADEAIAFSVFIGGKRTSDIEPVKNDGEAPKTVLDLQLEKIEVRATAEDTQTPADSFCCIRDTESGEQKMLFVGEEYKGWKLIAVKGTDAVFSYEGKEKALTLTKEPLPAVASNTPGAVNPNGTPVINPNVNTGPNPGPRPNPNGKQPANPIPVRPTPVRKDISRSFLKELSNKADKVVNDVYAQPFVVNGRSIGMQVKTIAPNSQLQAFGILPGDVIKSWNGRPITSESQCYDIFKQYRNNVDAIPAANNVIIIRNGQEQQLNINLR